MNKKPKIKISEEAFEYLKRTLESTNEYSLVRFAYAQSCCRPKVEIYLDTLQDELISDTVEDLPIQYNLDFADKIKSVTLIYNKSSLLIKPELYEEPIKNCGSCCKTKDTNCNGCRRDTN